MGASQVNEIAPMPFDLAAEEEVVCVLLNSPEGAERIVEHIGDDAVFYYTANQKIYDAAKSIKNKNGRITSATICDEINAHGGGDERVADKIEALSNPSYAGAIGVAIASAFPEETCARVRELAMRRRLITECHNVIGNLRNRANTMTECMSILSSAADIQIDDSAMIEKPDETYAKVKARLDDFYTNKKPISWKSGNWKIDRFSLGYFPGAINIVAARTGEGKTFFAWNRCLDFMSSTGLKAGIVSGEMSGHEIVERQVITDDVFADRSQVDDIGFSLIVERLNAYRSNPVEIAAMSDMKLDNVNEAIRNLARKGCKLVFVDYLQMIRTGHRDPNEGAFEAVAALKSQAVKRGIQIVLLSQLNKTGRRETGAAVSEADIYGASAYSFSCHMISIIMRLWLHDIADKRIERMYGVCQSRRLNPERTVIERIIKSRRGKPSYLTGYYTEKNRYRELTESEVMDFERAFYGKDEA